MNRSKNCSNSGMNEDVPEQFDLEQFKDELIQTTEKYAEAAHYTYGSGHTSEEKLSIRMSRQDFMRNY